MSDAEIDVPDSAVAPGRVTRAGRWAVGRQRDGTPFAVSRRCRHQLADLSKGSVDENGCLVCPWHQSKYDVSTGEMVQGPRGFLGYHGPTPGYTQLVRGYATVLKLRVARVTSELGRLVVRRGGSRPGG